MRKKEEGGSWLRDVKHHQPLTYSLNLEPKQPQLTSAATTTKLPLLVSFQALKLLPFPLPLPLPALLLIPPPLLQLAPSAEASRSNSLPRGEFIISQEN